MYKAVRSAIENNNAAWSGLPAFQSLYSQFLSQLSDLEAKAYEQTQATIGVSALTRQKREEVAELAYSMANSIKAFAVVSNKAELIEQIKFSQSEVRDTNKVRALQLIDLVIEKSTLYLNDLGIYGVSQQQIDDLTALREELEAMLNAPRNAILERKLYTSALEKISRNIDHLLREKLDKLAEVLKLTQPEFYEEYKNARVIIDFRAPRRSSETDPPKERDDGNE